MGKTKEFRISLDYDIKSQAQVISKLEKFTRRERTKLITDAIMLYFAAHPEADKNNTSVSQSVIDNGLESKLEQMLEQLTERLELVEQAVAGQAHQKAEESDAVSYINSESCPETENRSEIKHEEDRHVHEKTHSHESARREEVQDISEPDIPPAVLSMIEMLQNG